MQSGSNLFLKWPRRLAVCLALLAACRAGSATNAQDSSSTTSTTSQSPNTATTTTANTPNQTVLPQPPSAPAPSASDLCSSTTGRRVPVTTATELTAALADARPLDIIAVADGTYEGSFVAAAAGSANSPIALCGSANAILHGPSLTQGYTLYLQGAQYWEVVGLTVTGGAKGIMLDNAGHNLLKNLTVRSIGSEGIHLRTNSSDNLLDGCHVWQTGIAGDPMYGEGIYIGSSQTNWCTLTSGSADRSDRNIVQNCDVAQTTAECLDIKEGTTGGQILGNTLNGQGINLSAATSVVNIKGNQYLVQNNTVQHAPEDAFSVHVLLDGWGACNQFIANSANDTLTGYGVHLAAPKPWPAIEITSNNQFPLATSGISNAPLDGGVPPTHACQPSITTITCDG